MTLAIVNCIAIACEHAWSYTRIASLADSGGIGKFGNGALATLRLKGGPILLCRESLAHGAILLDTL